MRERLESLLRAAPFAPFVIATSNGREYRVEHPEFCIAGKGFAIVYNEAADVAHHVFYAAIESINVSERQQNR